MREVNLRGIDLNLLVLLELLIEHRNVTQAAAVANMSQPAMSRALGRLRALLDDPILARGRDGLVPTPRALALLPALRRALEEVRGLVARQDFDPASWQGEAEIAATDHQTITLLPPLVARLSREAPRLDLKVMPFQASALDALRDGRIQLSFGITEQALPPGLRRLPLHRDQFVVLLRAGHAAAEGDLTPEGFAALDHVLVTVLGEGRGVLDADLAAMGLRRRVALRLPHFYAAMAVVAQSDLVVTLPRSLAGQFAPGFGLVLRDLPFEREPFTTTLIWPEVLDRDPGNAWLRQVAVEEAGKIAGIIPLP
jgi:DNA-binding transcriptional LysR family regulator